MNILKYSAQKTRNKGDEHIHYIPVQTPNTNKPEKKKTKNAEGAFAKFRTGPSGMC